MEFVDVMTFDDAPPADCSGSVRAVVFSDPHKLARDVAVQGALDSAMVSGKLVHDDLVQARVYTTIRRGFRACFIIVTPEGAQ